MSRADLVHDPALTGQGPQRNAWFQDPLWQPISPFSVDGAARLLRRDAEINRGLQDVKAAFHPGEPVRTCIVSGETLYMTPSGIYRAVADPAIPESHSPAWHYVAVTMAIGLLFSALLFWLGPR